MSRAGWKKPWCIDRVAPIPSEVLKVQRERAFEWPNQRSEGLELRSKSMKTRFLEGLQLTGSEKKLQAGIHLPVL